MEILTTSLSAPTNIFRTKRLQIHSPWILVLALAAIGPLTAVAWADELTITTTPGPMVLLGSGQELTDSATLAGGITQQGGVGGLDGILSFVLASPATGVVYSSNVIPTGDGTFSGGGFVPTVAGQYSWFVTYSGDALNPMVSAGAELETVYGFSITTTPGPTVLLGSGQELTDSATLVGGITQQGGVGGLDGILSFVLASPATGVVYSSNVIPTGNGTFSGGGFVPTVAGQYSWFVTYSGDALNPMVDAGAELETVTGATPVPEPSTLEPLCACAILAGFIALARKRRMIAWSPGAGK